MQFIKRIKAQLGASPLSSFVGHGYLESKGSLSDPDIARLLGALIGVAIGATIAIVLACIIFPKTGVYEADKFGVLNWAKSWARQEDRQKAFYVFTLILGGAFGGLGARFRLGGDNPNILTVLFLAASVPVVNIVVGRAMVSTPFEATAYGFVVGAALILFSVLARVATRTGTEQEIILSPKIQTASDQSSASMWVTIPILVVGVVLNAALVIPLSVRSIAAPIGTDIHMAGTIIGPATFSFGRSLIPGIDYFTQYSVGSPWLFSFFLAPTAGDTLMNAIRFLVSEILFFQISLFFCLCWFLRGWAWSLVMTVAILMVQFTTATPLYAPSSTSARYVLLMVVAALFVWWVKRGLSSLVTILLALGLSSALFLGTETGIYACVAVAISTFLVVPGAMRCLKMVIALGVLTFLFFMLLSLIAFGPGVLDYRYVWYLFEPLLLYSSGLGAYPIEWFGGLHWLYNIISPAIALATVGWVAVTARQSQPSVAQTELAALALASLIGLFLSAKFVNMSLVALWQVNSIGFLIVLAWWSRVLIDRLGNGPLFGLRDGKRVAATGVLWILLGVFLCSIHDPRNPSLYAVQSYRVHPSLVSVLLAGTRYDCPRARAECNLALTQRDDVSLITRNTQPGERVALLLLQDWPLLVEARRASKFHFIPSVDVFTDRQLQESMRDINLVFLPRQPTAVLGVTHPDIAPILVPILKEKFSVIDESSSLLAWRKIR